MKSAEMAHQLAQRAILSRHQHQLWQLENWFPKVGERIEKAAKEGRFSEMVYAADLDHRLSVHDAAEALEHGLGYEIVWASNNQDFSVWWNNAKP